MLDDSLRFTVPRLQRSIHVSGAIHSVNSHIVCELVDALKMSSKDVWLTHTWPDNNTEQISSAYTNDAVFISISL